jgi:hypothetical protein
MRANNSMLSKASDYVIKTTNDLVYYARELSQYRFISSSQQQFFLLFANELENTRDKWANGWGL